MMPSRGLPISCCSATSRRRPPALRTGALLPLFYEKAATPAMIKHGMDVQRRATEHLNLGQIPVTTFNQPLHVCIGKVCTTEMAHHLW